jgi:peptide/nickel transport system substrate-binding protein
VRLKKTAASVAATGMALALAACGGGSSDSSSAGGSGGSGTLTLGAVVPASTQAAADAHWANESPYMQAVYDSLIHLSPEGEPQPWLATKWSYNKDNTVLTMKLRTDVTFTDGTPFTADVAAQNILRFRDGTSPNASNLASVKDAKAVDDSTLQITLNAPDPALLVYLGQNGGLQESPKAFEAGDLKTKPVGSGPYVLDTGKTVVGSKYVYTKNPDYWAPDQVHYDNLTINVLPDAQTQTNAIRGGQVTGLNVADQSTVDQMEQAGFTAYPHELDWTGLLLMDREGKVNPALGKVEVRQAINYAIDRDAMLKAVAKGRGTVTGQIFPTTSPAYDESLDSMYAFDPAKAKQLLADAGYADGFELDMPLIQGTTVVNDLIKQYLGDVGITVNYTQLSINDAISAILAPKYAASWFQLQMDPTAWQLANFQIAAKATWNPFHVDDPQVDKFMNTIQNGNEAAADQAAASLNKYVVDQAWFAPFYRVEGNFVADGNTDVVQQSDNAYPYLWNIKPKA